MKSCIGILTLDLFFHTRQRNRARPSIIVQLYRLNHAGYGAELIITSTASSISTRFQKIFIVVDLSDQLWIELVLRFLERHPEKFLRALSHPARKSQHPLWLFPE